MSKNLNVSTGNYTVKVQPGGEITLDTGVAAGTGVPGKVVINGNLEVHGTSTSVSTTDLNFEDNIILLNRPDTGTEPNFNGVLRNNGTAGIRIERGALLDALWVFDERIIWVDPGVSGTQQVGGWSPRDQNEKVIGVELTSITTPNGTDLNLLGRFADGSQVGAANPGLVTVRGTNTATGNNNSYSDRINALPEADRADVIPNVHYVNRVLEIELSTAFQDTIQEGTFNGTETRIEVQDTTVTSNPSKAIIAINGIIRNEFYETSAQMYNVEISGVGNNAGTISSKSTIGNQDLVLTAEGVGRVVIQDDVVLTRTPHNNTGVTDPSQPNSGISLYNKEPAEGGTGVYFINEEGTRDELISSNRALVYSMLF